MGNMGIGTVPNRRSIVLRMQGKRQPEGLVRGERGALVNAEI